MSMRITNKIMQNNSLTNINANKVQQDKLNTQMTTGKKITRPSDDPVIAIRALRLRTTLSDVTQYRDKNAEDADSWLKVTEDSIVTTVDVIEDMIEQCNKGAKKSLQSSDRDAILEALKNLRDEVYCTGDADYAGRGVFTGYRTGVKLRFEEEEKRQYTIVEQLNKSAMDDITYINTAGLENVNAGNYKDAGQVETDVSVSTVHRLRLSYNELDREDPEGNAPTITYMDAMGVQHTLTAEVVSLYDTKTVAVRDIDDNIVAGQTKEISPYEYANDPDCPGGVVFIPETGELIFSDKVYQALSSTQDRGSTQKTDEGVINITYSKTNWDKGDLRPEHYFYCKSKGVTYNEEFYDPANPFAKPQPDAQVISYDVGFNQEIRVNTLANELYTHDIGRDVDDLVSVLEEAQEMEKTIADLKGALEKDPDDEAAAERLKAAEKAMTYINEKLQKSFEHGITKMQNHLENANLALTNVGNRSAKLELIMTRLSSQKTNFKDLVADNEQADTAEVAIDLSSAKLAYDAALMATAKIAQSSLMNYI